MSENKPGLGGQEVNPQEEQMKRDMFSSWMGERGGYLHELTSMKDPIKVKKSIEELSAVAFGLPCSKIEEEYIDFSINQNTGEPEFETKKVSLVSKEELMQIFMSPDYMANKKGAGYYAETSLTQVLLGTGRMEVVNGMVGPGRKYSENEAREITNLLIERNKISEDQRSDTEKKLNNSLKQESVDTAEMIREEAKRFRAQRTVWDAFGNHQQTSGDEKTASQLFVTPGHGVPQGPDWKEFFKDEKNNKDRALRQIYATGLSYAELVRTENKEYLIEGIHFKVNKEGNTVPLSGNVYAEGWTTDKFEVWIDAILDKTDGDLLAAYDCWYAAIVTGLVAKVAVNGVKVGDPPLVSSLDAWLMHFKEKQFSEAGLDENGDRKKYQVYKSKTGAIETIGQYPDSWMGSYFDVAKVGEEGRSIFELWWKDKTPIAKVPWIKTDIQLDEEEIRLGSFDGWLYSKFQLFKMLDVAQGVPELKELSGYTYWQGMARSLDKAFGVVYDLPKKADPLWQANVLIAKGEGKIVNERRKVTRDGKEFEQTVPDSLNPRMVLLKGILTRYRPGLNQGARDGKDTSPVYAERFSVVSEELKKTRTRDFLGNVEIGDPGAVSIDLFIYSFVDSGMVTFAEMNSALRGVYDKDTYNNILTSSKKLSKLLQGKE